MQTFHLSILVFFSIVESYLASLQVTKVMNFQIGLGKLKRIGYNLSTSLNKLST